MSSIPPHFARSVVALSVVDLLKVFEAKALAAALTEAGYSVSERTVQRWKAGQTRPKPQDIRAIRELVGVQGTTKEPPPEWAGELLDEVRMNRAVIQAMFAAGDPALVQRILDRFAALGQPPTSSGDEAPDPIDAAT